ncbi:hypothetical protein LC609_19505 [Nostoc sp. XA013]|nr:hypothetical protein [Nostoc sp. XA013]
MTQTLENAVNFPEELHKLSFVYEGNEKGNSLLQISYYVSYLQELNLIAFS